MIAITASLQGLLRCVWPRQHQPSMPSTAFENGINEGQLYQWVRKYNIQSMSRKGNGYGNCIMETFFGRMKNEMYYGNDRIQPKTKWMPPVKYKEASIC